MGRNPNSEAIGAQDLETGDTVVVHLNSRAQGNLGVSKFRAKVERTSFDDVTFRPINQLQEDQETHTWYSDIGYIHGYHDGLGRYSDIGKVRKVTQA